EVTKNKDQDKIIKEEKFKVQIPIDIREPLDTIYNSWKKKVEKFMDKVEPNKRSKHKMLEWSQNFAKDINSNKQDNYEKCYQSDISTFKDKKKAIEWILESAKEPQNSNKINNTITETRVIILEPKNNKKLWLEILVRRTIIIETKVYRTFECLLLQLPTRCIFDPGGTIFLVLASLISTMQEI
ncbi:12756_t:CDS:2, partial [Ambispora leptoticha]